MKIFPHMKLAEVLLIASANMDQLQRLAADAAEHVQKGIRIHSYFFADGSELQYDDVTGSASAV